MRRNFLRTAAIALLCVATLFSCGKDGTDGKNGTNGTNGADGTDGADGVAPVLIEIVNSLQSVDIALGETAAVTFRVNPSNASVPTGTGVAIADWSLDQTGTLTKASYVTAPDIFELASIQPDGNKTGQYIATIRQTGEDDDLSVSTYMMALVLSVEGTGLVSSATFTLSPKIDILTCMYQDGGGDRLIAMLPDGTGRKMLYSSDAFGLIHPSIGSDGKTLLFTSGADVYSYNLVSRTLTKLTSTNEEYYVPVFSPDMSKVYVLYRDQEGVESFISINVATKAVTVIDNENRVIYPSFTADGKIVCNPGWQEHVGIMNADGTGLTLLREADEYTCYIHPLAVPALNKIVYVEQDDNAGTYNVRVMNTDGSGDALLAGPEGNQLSSPSANAQGTKLAYFRSTGGGKVGNIIVGDFNGTALSNATAVFSYAEESILIWRPQFHRISKAAYNTLDDLYTYHIIYFNR